MRAGTGADYLEILRIPKQKAVEWEGRWVFLWLVVKAYFGGGAEKRDEGKMFDCHCQ